MLHAVQFRISRFKLLQNEDCCLGYQNISDMCHFTDVLPDSLLLFGTYNPVASVSLHLQLFFSHLESEDAILNPVWLFVHLVSVSFPKIILQSQRGTFLSHIRSIKCRCQQLNFFCPQSNCFAINLERQLTTSLTLAPCPRNAEIHFHKSILRKMFTYVIRCMQKQTWMLSSGWYGDWKTKHWKAWERFRN